MEISLQTLSVIIGVITLIIGVANSINTNKKTIQSHNIQIILSVSESFRSRWEASWSDILDDLEADHLNPLNQGLSSRERKDIRYMLNWVDWLGAMASSKAIADLSVLTTSIGIPLRRIINAGYTVIDADVKKHGLNYWSNLIVVAEHLDMKIVPMLKNSAGSKG